MKEKKPGVLWKAYFSTFHLGDPLPHMSPSDRNIPGYYAKTKAQILILIMRHPSLPVKWFVSHI